MQNLSLDISLWQLGGKMKEDTLILAATSIAIWLTLIVYIFLLKATQKGSQSQNLLTLINFLQDPNLRKDREILLTNAKPMDSWTPMEIESAERVCGAYDITGILVKHKIVPKDIITDNWGHSIIKCYNAASQLIEKARKERKANYWENFEWLVKQIAVNKVS